MNRFAKRLACPINTDCRSKCINIRNLVSHDHNTFLGTHKFLECLCFDTGLNTGSLLHLLCLTAIISDIITILDHYLITTASKCHLDRDSGIFIILQVGSSIKPHTDT